MKSKNFKPLLSIFIIASLGLFSVRYLSKSNENIENFIYFITAILISSIVAIKLFNINKKPQYHFPLNGLIAFLILYFISSNKDSLDNFFFPVCLFVIISAGFLQLSRFHKNGKVFLNWLLKTPIGQILMFFSTSLFFMWLQSNQKYPTRYFFSFWVVALLFSYFIFGVYIGYWRKCLIVFVSTSLSLVVLYYLAGPFVLSNIVLPYNNLDIDHRMTRQPGYTNEDGVRPPISPHKYKQQEYNIIFLGDSFTEGSSLFTIKEKPFPALVEKILSEKFPNRKFRCANFGWSSSSPVLQLRQLKDIAHKYNPDLIVQAFDMSDFWDDLHYTNELSNVKLGSEYEVTIFRAMGVRFFGTPSFLEKFYSSLIFYEKGKSLHVVNDSFTRYFHMFIPLEESKPFFELTWKTILETKSYANELGANYVLIILPRFQQYNKKECPKCEREEYWPSDDKYIHDVFKYFDEKKSAAPFNIHSLLEDFQNSGKFPTTFEDDIHYNQTGHKIAADAIARHLINDGYINNN